MAWETVPEELRTDPATEYRGRRQYVGLTQEPVPGPEQEQNVPREAPAEPAEDDQHIELPVVEAVAPELQRGEEVAIEPEPPVDRFHPALDDVPVSIKRRMEAGEAAIPVTQRVAETVVEAVSPELQRGEEVTIEPEPPVDCFSSCFG